MKPQVLRKAMLGNAVAFVSIVQLENSENTFLRERSFGVPWIYFMKELVFMLGVETVLSK